MAKCVYCGKRTADYVAIERKNGLDTVCKECYFRLWATDEEREEMKEQGYRFAQDV